MEKINSTRESAPSNEAPTSYKGRAIGFYHPNNRGAGTALRIEPRLNRDDADRYNCFFFELAPQKTLASRQDGRQVAATFEWDKKITVKLGFLDISELLVVLEGRALRIGGERSGLYHASGTGNTLISFQKSQEHHTYYLALSCKRGKEDEPQKLGITLSEAEATGMRCLLQTGLFFITFSALFRDAATAALIRKAA